MTSPFHDPDEKTLNTFLAKRPGVSMDQVVWRREWGLKQLQAYREHVTTFWSELSFARWLELRWADERGLIR